MEYRITVLPEGREVAAKAGALLLDVLRECGCYVDAPCGGRGKCGKCAVIVDGQPVRSCRYAVTGDVTVELPGQEPLQILEQGTANPVSGGGRGYAAAVDIGTTTVVCALLDAAGRTLAVESTANPQAAYGADVVSRINAAVRGQGSAMTALIRSAVTGLLERCCAAAAIPAAEIKTICVVGNPCMRQLFLGLPVDNLAAVPFAPVLTTARQVPAGEYFPRCANACLQILPDIGGFVGTDTLGCILASRLYEAPDTVLLVDIGTNGEMVLCHRGRMVACSTAAGPALEGANIRFGMRAAAGAIDHVSGEGIRVIGGGEALGICGSGLIDAVAVMLDKGLLNRRGKILTADSCYALTERVCLTQEDIRQVQLAKGAIAAGVERMAALLGIRVEAIDRCVLAGAFGSYLDPDSACRMGLLPEPLRGRIAAAGNLALEGAKLLAADPGQLALARELTGRVECLNLAALPEFPRCFAQNMYFREERHG